MRKTLLFAILFVALAVAAVAFLPASLVDGRVAAMSAGKLRVTDASGTLWNGRGTLTDAGGAWRIPFAWQVNPIDVLRGQREVTLLPAGSATVPKGVVGMRGDGVEVRDLALEVPARALAALLPPGVAPALGGTITVTSPGLIFTHGDPAGALDAHWTGARIVAGDAVADLGTVHLAAKPQGNGLSGILGNEGGNVRVEGTLSYTAPAIAVDATLTPGADASPALLRLFASLGAQDSAGRARFAWRGNVR